MATVKVLSLGKFGAALVGVLQYLTDIVYVVKICTPCTGQGKTDYILKTKGILASCACHGKTAR